jgi:glycosyltransferase involved in cell wall biosynthesis
MTRVLLGTDVVGGVWTYSMELAAALSARGVRVDLAVLGPGVRADHLREAARRGVDSAYPVPGALEWMPEPWAEVEQAGYQLLELAHELRSDVVHLGGYAHAALPWPVPTVVVGHSCVSSWWRAVHREATPMAEYRRRVRAGLNAADAVVAPSAAMLAELRREYGLSRGVVIPNGRSAGWATSGEKQPLVLAAGRVWDPAKNLSMLARAGAGLPWPVVIAGETVPPDGHAARPDAAVNVSFAGPLDFGSLSELLLRASIYAAPALYEPFGLGPLEAGLAGCALVLGDIPSLREVWGDAAAFVDPRDPEAIRSAVRALIFDPRLRGELGERARRRARHYTPERMASAYLQLYADLTVRQRRSVGAR